MSLDKVPGAGELYIGGIFTLKARTALKNASITHVVSALWQQVDADLVKDFEHHVVPVDDVDDQDILQYFPASNAFIQSALQQGGGVFVHCMMGKSRSATLVCAYLLNKDPTRSPHEVLAQLQTTHPIAEPNEGFMKQLELYQSMGCPDDIESQPAYQRWLFERLVRESTDVGQAPESIRFEDETNPPQEGATDYKILCRKCRRSLATSAYVVPHEPKTTPAPQDTLHSAIESIPSTKQSAKLNQCAHLFVDPLSWMRDELEQGRLDGRLECPKCRSNVGKYAWQGMKCSCGKWIVPGISLSRSKVDEVRAQTGGPPARGLPGKM